MLTNSALKVNVKVVVASDFWTVTVIRRHVTFIVICAIVILLLLGFLVNYHFETKSYQN